jgi:hypothetical protein
MVEPKTVSNLPVDVSIRWAEDQKFLEETRPMIMDAGTVPSHTQKDVLFPFAFSEIDVLLGIRRVHPTWAHFLPPSGYHEQRRRLFTSQVAPTIGSEEELDNKIQRIGAAGEKEEDEAEKRKKETFLKLLKLMLELDKNLTFVLTRRTQYQKG